MKNSPLSLGERQTPWSEERLWPAAAGGGRSCPLERAKSPGVLWPWNLPAGWRSWPRRLLGLPADVRLLFLFYNLAPSVPGLLGSSPLNKVPLVHQRRVEMELPRRGER